MQFRRWLVWCVLLAACSFASGQNTALSWDSQLDSVLGYWETNRQVAGDSLLACLWADLQAQDHLYAYLESVRTAAKFWRRAEQPVRAVTHYEQGLPEALWRPVSDSLERDALAWLYVNLGYTYSETLGRYRQALSCYKQATSIFDQLQANTSLVARYVWLPLSALYTRLGDYQAAESLLLRQTDFARSRQQHEASAMGYADLGLLYHNWGKPELARKTFAAGLELTGISDRISTFLHCNLAAACLAQEDLTAASRHLRAAAQHIQQLQVAVPDHPLVPYLQGTLASEEAELAAAQHHFPAALQALAQAQDHLADYYGSTQRREFGKHYNQVARVYRQMGAYEQAILQAQQALQAVLYDYDAQEDPLALPDDQSLYAENTIEEALEEMALSFRAWYEASGETSYLEQALHCYEKIHLVDQALRRSYLYESSKLYNLEDSRRRAEAAIAIAHSLLEQLGEPAYAYQALVFAERDRSHLLREAYRSSRATLLAGLDDQRKKQEQELQFLVQEAEQKLFHYRSRQDNEAQVLAAEQRLLLVRDSLHQFLKTLEAENPRYYQLKYADDIPDLEALRTILSPGQLLVEFFVGEDKLYAFTLTRSSELELISLPLPSDLEGRIMRWRNSIESYQQHQVDRPALLATYRKEGYELYQSLLAPVLADRHVESLLLIPSGILDLLPFEALLLQATDATSRLQDYPYLLRHYSCSYGYSASLQYMLRQLPYAGQGFGGYSPVFDGQQGWQALSCSSQNLAEVPWSGQRFLYAAEKATRDSFLQHAGRFAVLHLATHAQANAERGDFSFIVFSDGEQAYDSLFAQSLYHLDLPNELVVLSACETALGTLYQSEGVISLGRAFHYAGARSVLTTLWQVNEGANCRLMPGFYAQLDEGSDKATALQQAKIAYLEKADERAAHPVYWAGYQLLGNARPLAHTTNTWRFWLGGLLFLLLGGGWWYRYRQSEKRSHS